ncbi:MAG TPA: tetratricopeptide repeat protein, partial [Polyangiaceae bacterium]|nr:tetratricopeptide repeat protein [Polyangiaceae bacterium]
ATFKLAAFAAGESGAEGAEARARLGLAFALSELGKFDAAHDWAEYAGALAKRLPDAEFVEVDRLSTDGWISYREGKYERAAASLHEALATAGRWREPRPEALALLHNRLGSTLGGLRRVDEALEHFEREDALVTAALGAEHPDRARNFTDRANVLLATKRYEDAIAFLLRAIALWPPGASQHAVALTNLGEANEGLGRHREASEHYERALAIAAKATPPQHWFVGVLEVRRGRTLARLGRVAEGLAACERGLSLTRGSLESDHEYVVEALECVGSVRAGSGQAKAALAPLEQALAIRQAGGDAEKIAAVRAMLADARAAAHGP